MTYFRNTLVCPHCKQTGTAWLPSGFCDRGATYQTGDCVDGDISLIGIEDASFKVREPKADEDMHVLLSWECEHCKLTSFAEVVLAEECVRSISSVELDPLSLTRLHYLADTIENMLETIIGERLHSESGLRPDWLPALREALNAGRRW